MAYTHFKPEIWKSKIELTLPKFTVFENDCNYQIKGEVKKGATVHILGTTRPAIFDYKGEKLGDPEVFDGVKQTMKIDQAKAFQFEMDDVDEDQSLPGVMDSYIEEATRALAEERDAFIAGLAKEAEYASGSTLVSTKTNAKTAFDKAIVQLLEQGVKPGRDKVTAYLTPKFYMLMADHILDTRTQNDKALATGDLGNYMGVNIKITNNAYNDGEGGVGGDDHIIIKTDKAIAFASSLNEVEALRSQVKFADIMRGLNTFGGKVVRQKELYVVKAHYE